MGVVVVGAGRQQQQHAEVALGVDEDVAEVEAVLGGHGEVEVALHVAAEGRGQAVGTQHAQDEELVELAEQALVGGAHSVQGGLVAAPRAGPGCR